MPPELSKALTTSTLKVQLKVGFDTPAKLANVC